MYVDADKIKTVVMQINSCFIDAFSEVIFRSNPDSCSFCEVSFAMSKECCEKIAESTIAIHHIIDGELESDPVSDGDPKWSDLHDLIIDSFHLSLRCLVESTAPLCCMEHTCQNKEKLLSDLMVKFNDISSRIEEASKDIFEAIVSDSTVEDKSIETPLFGGFRSVFGRG